jgi:hypothetical protein
MQFIAPPTKRKSGTQRDDDRIISISSPVHTFANSKWIGRQTTSWTDDLLLTPKTNKGTLLLLLLLLLLLYPSFHRYLLRWLLLLLLLLVEVSSRASLVLRAVSDRMNLESPWRGFMASSSHRVNLKCLLLEQSVIIDRTWDEHVEQSRLRWTWSRL